VTGETKAEKAERRLMPWPYSLPEEQLQRALAVALEFRDCRSIAPIAKRLSLSPFRAFVLMFVGTTLLLDQEYGREEQIEVAVTAVLRSVPPQ
jgi:hypothetical protein